MRYDLVNSTKQVDLGTLTWTKALSPTPIHYFATINDLYQTGAYGQTTYGNLNDYTRDTGLGVPSNKRYNFIAIHNYKQIVIRDDELSGLSAVQFKAAMSGKILTYVSTDGPRRFDMVYENNLNNSNYRNQGTGSYGEGVRLSLVTPVPCIAGHKYRIELSDYTSWKNTINSNASANYPWTTFTYCGNEDTWKYQPYEFTCTNTGWFSLLLGKRDDRAITAQDLIDEGITVKLLDLTASKRFTFVNDTAQVDLGSQDWQVRLSGGLNRFVFAKLPGMETGNTHMFLDEYRVVSAIQPLDDKYVYIGVTGFNLFDNALGYNDAGIAALKAKLNGRILTYQSTTKETN